MRATSPWAAPACALALTFTTACTGQDEPAPERPAGWGHTVAVPHPVGAYEHEFTGEEADAFYRVEDVTGQHAPDIAGFTLVADLPELGRPLGFNGFSVTCTAGGEVSAAEHEDLPGEVFGGLFEIPMECSVPEGAAFLTVAMEHAGETVVFSGPM